MSCCEPKKGLARVAEEPGMILAAYICALLPLAAIYAFDFITGEWKSVRRTRCNGKGLLAISLPPLAVVIFYIHLQKLAKDYKEMATATTAAILCIWHVLRTVWGLLQLRAFKRWNIHALRVLTRMGFEAPIYGQAQSDAASDESSSKSESRGNKVCFRVRIGKCFSAFGRRIRAIFGFERLVQLKPPKPFLGDEDIERTVDNHMMVNSSLVDNEFIAAALPCRPIVTRLLNGLSVSWPIRIACTKAEECAVRWTVSFLSRFGAEWLIQTKMLTNFKKIRGQCDTKSCSADLRNRLAAFIAFHVTRPVHTEENRRRHSQCVSILSPHHAICSDLVEPWSSNLAVTAANALPYQLRGSKRSEDLKFEDHAISIRNRVSAWPEKFLNELSDPEKYAVSHINPLQVACFSKLLEEQNSSRLGIYKKTISPHFEWGFNAFLCQLGYDFGLFEEDDSVAQEITNKFCGALPVLKESLVSENFHGQQRANDFCLLQASVHVDNWTALEAGKTLLTDDTVEHEDNFSAQKRIELRRLGFEVAAPQESSTSAMRKIKFLGCIMESVRRTFTSTSWDSPVDWKPSVDFDKKFLVNCSDQLNDALQWSRENQPGDCRQRSVYMRMLWEIQLALLSSDSVGNHSLMLLCMLGYPSLRISKVENFRQVHPSLSSGDGFVSVNIIETSAERGERNRCMQSTRREKSARKCSFKIVVVGAPEQLHIIFQWDSVSKKATVQICPNGDQVLHFDWQRWKDAFMGRVCAQLEWRAKYLRVKTEIIQEKAAVEGIAKGFSDVRGLERGFENWRGWPSFQNAILSDFFGHRRRIPELNEMEEDIDVTSESECDCSCRGHTAFLQAKELFKSGREKDACELFGRCITHYGHSLALEQYVSDVTNKLADNSKIVGQLLYRMSILYKTTEDKNYPEATLQCRKFKPCDLLRIIQLFDNVYEKTGEAEALYYQGRALFRRSASDAAVDDKCIGAFESYLALCDSRRFFGPSHFCLMLCYFVRHCSTRQLLDKELGLQHFESYCQHSSVLGYRHGVDIAVLFEKGSLPKRVFERNVARTGSCYERFPIDQDLSKDIFLPSRYIEHRISANTEVASCIYNSIFPDGEPNPQSLNHAQLRACNRLALMYHMGVNDFDKDLEKAKELYTRAITYTETCRAGSDGEHKTAHSINALCNLGVWYGQQHDDDDVAKLSVKHFKDAVSENVCRCSECAEKHSSSLNNLAVITEYGRLVEKDIDEAKQLYRRSVDIDENPVAMYNLAVLLKFGDNPSLQDLEEAKSLLSQVVDLGIDFMSTPVLNNQVTKALHISSVRLPDMSEGLPFAVEEIDDCLAYVKIVERTH